MYLGVGVLGIGGIKGGQGAFESGHDVLRSRRTPVGSKAVLAATLSRGKRYRAGIVTALGGWVKAVGLAMRNAH
jgi:hypothetical protein